MSTQGQNEADNTRGAAKILQFYDQAGKGGFRRGRAEGEQDHVLYVHGQIDNPAADEKGGEEQQDEPETEDGQVEAEDEFSVGDEQFRAFYRGNGGNRCQCGNGREIHDITSHPEDDMRNGIQRLYDNLALFAMEAVATPKKTAKTTICRI